MVQVKKQKCKGNWNNANIQYNTLNKNTEKFLKDTKIMLYKKYTKVRKK